MIDLLGDDSEPEKEQAQIDPDWIDEFTKQLVGEEETGPAVAKNLANIVGKMLKMRQTEDRTKALLEKYHTVTDEAHLNETQSLHMEGRRPHVTRG